MENLQTQQSSDLVLSRRQLLAAGATAMLGASDESFELLQPNTETVDSVEVLGTNLSFISPTRPDGLAWNTHDWVKMLNHTTYEGLEAHYFNTQGLHVIGAPLAELLREGLVKSFHQSVRGDNDTSLQSRFLPTATESLGLLYTAESTARSGPLPLVVFPEQNLHAIARAQATGDFASYSAQPKPGLFKVAGTASLNGLRRWLSDHRIGMCWASFHYQESEAAFGRDRLGDWQDTLPAIAENPNGELEEIHLEIGRIDGDPALAAQTMHELSAFINGPDEALRTTSGQMLETIFRHTSAEQKRRLIVEVNQAGLVNYLGALSIWPLREPIFRSHRRIVKTVREIAQG